MPTSTLWRKRPIHSGARGISPDRPAADSVERLSPEPLRSPAFTQHSRYNWNEAREDGDPLRGLGLLQSGFAALDGVAAQPDHLYFDQNGGAHVAAKARPSQWNHESHPSHSSTHTEHAQNRPGSYHKRPKEKVHTRSRSTIDDLASIAIATSPGGMFTNGSSPAYRFNGSPLQYSPSRPATSYVNGYSHDDNFSERPAKRIKSEKLHAMEWSPRDERPRPSNIGATTKSMLEAELLLSLRNGFDFKIQQSPAANGSEFHHENSSTAPAKTVFIEEMGTAQIRIFKEAAKFAGGLDEAMVSHTALAGQQSPIDSKHANPQEAENDRPDSLNDVRMPDAHQQSEHEEVDDPYSEAVINNTVLTNGIKSVSSHEANPAGLPKGTAEERVENSAAPTAVPKKPRRVKPEVQAEVCALCQRLQRDLDDDKPIMLWISCGICNRWFHSKCAGFRDKREAESVDKFVCKDCEPDHGQTTFVRKSSRARTAIDYASLNQGEVKSSADTSMHHYIQPIKNGTIKFLPDDFARVRPELLNAEWWEGLDGLRRPFVVPASFNPRFGVSNISSQSDDAIQLVETRSSDTRGEEQVTVEHVPTFEFEEVIDCEQDFLDMVMPRDLTVGKVSELYGPSEPVPVIDVKTQETKGVFTLKDWAEYYELPGEKPIRNVISLEVSNSRLGRLIRRPKVVRDIDLEDQVWDADASSAGKKRPVQFYCLMSVADSYTDFHIDFGGSSVYYHILKGVKTFFFIPPEDKYLKKYEEWCNSDTQNDTFLGDLCGGNCTRVDLHEGDTAFIPAGWIHAVWTPEDSLVIGGNFLTRSDYELQLKVANVEKTTRVPQKFRYPFFQKVMWYTLIKYLEDDPVPADVLQDFFDDPGHVFLRANPVWLDEDLDQLAEPGDPDHNARSYAKSELTGLPALRDYLYRTARIYADLPVVDINKKQIDAVKASIPKGHGDPMHLIEVFAIWCAWKIGNVTAPEWVYSDNGTALEMEKRERMRKPEVFKLPGERVSTRKASQAHSATPPADSIVTPMKLAVSAEESEDDSANKTSSKGSNGRIACDQCRKRRIKCRHKDDRGKTPNAIDDLTPVKIEPQFDPSQITMATAPSSSGSKKGRSKACEECRKSKRRCVHDEYGRVDAMKAALPAKPRGSLRLGSGSNLDAMIDPALMALSPTSPLSPISPTSPPLTYDHVSYSPLTDMARKASTPASDMGADERLARELQAAQNGLRRRTSVRL